ncbi:MAG: class I SAM-dependent methyltransferase [Candidatus Heimdallarchaeaceae archaeon]
MDYELIEAYRKISHKYTSLKRKPWKDFQHYMKLIRQNYPIPTSGIILDVGTGNCRNLLFFEDQKWEHIGFDVSFELLDNAITLEKNRIYHVNNDMKFLSLRNNFADFALCIATLHHLRNKRDAVKVLKNIRSTLKKIMLEKMEEGFKERDAERFDILSIQKIEK